MSGTALALAFLRNLRHSFLIAVGGTLLLVVCASAFAGLLWSLNEVGGRFGPLAALLLLAVVFAIATAFGSALIDLRFERVQGEAGRVTPARHDGPKHAK